MRKIEKLGSGGLLLFAFCAWLSTAGAYIGIGVMLLATILSLPRYHRALAREPLVWLSILFLIYLSIRALAAARVTPPASEVIFGSTESWIRLLFFWVAALWLRGNLKLVWLVLSLSATGLLVRMGMHLDWSQPLEFVRTRRSYGFGLTHISYGLYAGTILLGLTVFACRIFNALSQRIRVAGIVAWLLMSAAYLQGLLVSSSRGAWLAFCISGTIVLTVSILKAQRMRITMRSASFTVVAATIIVGVIGFNVSSITSRLSLEHQTFAKILAFDWASIPYTSVGARIHLYIYGIERWIQHPWVGLGPGMVGYSLEHGPPMLAPHPHLHNTFLELLVETGIIGSAFFILVLVRLGYALSTSSKMPRDLKLFLLGAWVMWFIWGLSDFHITHTDGSFHWYLLTAISSIYIFAKPIYGTDTSVWHHYKQRQRPVLPNS